MMKTWITVIFIKSKYCVKTFAIVIYGLSAFLFHLISVLVLTLKTLYRSGPNQIINAKQRERLLLFYLSLSI